MLSAVFPQRSELKLKTYLRSTTSEQRLNHVCVLAIERELSDVLLKDSSTVINKFAAPLIAVNVGSIDDNYVQ